jgi:hypothetical protein
MTLQERIDSDLKDAMRAPRPCGRIIDRVLGTRARYSPSLAWPHMKRIAGLYIAWLIAAAMPVFALALATAQMVSGSDCA